MHDDLDTAVEELFRAFAGAPLHDRVDYCDHCVDPEQVEALRVTPLRRLDPEQLGPLLFNALYTWGDVAYLRHFLPRLLQLVASGAMEDWSYPVFLPGRLARCRTEGTEEERTAIARFLRAWWSDTVSAHPGPCLPRDVLEVIDGCGVPVRPYLDTWSLTTGEAAARNLAAFVADWVTDGTAPDRLAAEVDAWLRGDAPLGLLGGTGDPAGEFSDAAESLARYRTRPAR